MSTATRLGFHRVGVALCVLLLLLLLPLTPGTRPAASGTQPPRDTPRHFQAPAGCGRLRVVSASLSCADGTRFRWNGVTAFALLDQLADGRRTDAEAYMRWARAEGFNLVRVLAMADVLFTLAPGDGRPHLDGLFEMAAEQGLYVEVVALADTGRLNLSRAGLLGQVAAVGRAAAAHANAIVQIANEHYHPTQSRDLHDPAVLRELARAIPGGVLYTESAASDDAAREPQGLFITRHLSRSGTRARMLDGVMRLGALAAETGKPVVNDEPIGAGERDVPGRRVADPAFFRDLARRGVEARLAGATFHCEDGMFARVPGPVQRACARAWSEGAMVTLPGSTRRP